MKELLNLRLALRTLSPREEECMILRYGLETNNKIMKYKELSEIIGVSKTRCGQIIKKAIHKLCHPSRDFLLIEEILNERLKADIFKYYRNKYSL